MKKCCKCQLTKDYTSYYRSASTTGGYRNDCKDCHTIRAKNYKRKNLQSYREYKRKSDLKCYGLSIEDYGRIHESQNGLCLICDKPETARSNTGGVRRLNVDHCHRTGKVRGLLCSRCNVGIGSLGESRETLLKAIEYLKKWADE